MITAAAMAAAILLEAQRAEESSAQLLNWIQLQSGPPGQHPSSPGEETNGAESEPAEPWEDLDVAGVLSIPDLGLELPVLAQSDEDLLQIAVGCFSGTYAPQPDRLIIAGHNYRGHFGRLDELSIGAAVCFQPLSGEESTYTYTVEAVEWIDADDLDALYTGEWDMTLLSCNFDRSKRILIRCRE